MTAPTMVTTATEVETLTSADQKGVGELVVGATSLMRFTIAKGILETRPSYIVNLLAKDFPG